MYLPIEIEERRIIQQWLRQDRRNPKVQLQVPKSGNPKELVSMATENAIETLRALKTQWANDTHKQSQSLAELETALELPRTPNRIECYDISNTQGTLSVGSRRVRGSSSRGSTDRSLLAAARIAAHTRSAGPTR